MLKRYLSSIASGSVMTFALLYLMQLLIGFDFTAPAVAAEVHGTVVHRPPSPAPVEQPEQRTDRRSLTTIAQVPDRQVIHEPIAPPTGFQWLAPTVPNDVSPVVHSAPMDSPLVAMIRLEPTYPAALQARGVEGFVDIEFDVVPSGNVVNVRVVNSSHRGFEQAAIRAAKRFRFKAQVVDGVPQTTVAVRNRFTFTLDH